MRSPRLVAGIAVLAVAGGLGAARASTTDRSAPESSFLTSDGAVVVSTPARADRVGGPATDTGSGIASVSATFTPILGGVETIRRSDLGCASSARTSCRWWAIPPYVPGTYRVTVSATDRAGNVERASDAITITVL